MRNRRDQRNRLSPNARSLALQVLLQTERTSSPADEAIDRALRGSGLDARDRALTLELVYGILRHRATLDWRLRHVSERPLDRLPPSVLAALRLGAYQLLYLSRIPASAAVNESVRLIAARGRRDWGGFVNAVLRGLIRQRPPSWPDARTDPAMAYAIRYSCPCWLAARWVSRHGAEQAETLCRATTAIPPLTIRVNTLRWTREGLQQAFLEKGCAVRPTAVSPVGLVLEKAGPTAELPFFEDGAFYVEDEAAQLVALILDPRSGERILDACAAPGGKATHVASRMHNRGQIVALDRNAARLRLLQENCRRLGIEILKAVQADATRPPLYCAGDASVGGPARAAPFDRILIDAPCSGLGVLRRHPEGKWHKQEAQLIRHQAAQLRILEALSPALRPGGVLVYSTCSTEPEENEHVIERFCHAHPEFSLESAAPWLPPTGRRLVNTHGYLSTMFSPYAMDAFFAARLRKAS